MKAMLNTTPASLNSLPWRQISQIVHSDKFSDKFESIPTETLKFAADKQNQEVLVKEALKSLKISDPERANIEQAVIVAEMMRGFATQILRERNLN